MHSERYSISALAADEINTALRIIAVGTTSVRVLESARRVAGNLVPQDGETDIFFKGLGRPQGLAFDRDGNLYVAAAFRGRRGIVRISPDGDDAKLVVAGVNLIGLAFSATGEMAVVSIDSVYSLSTQIKGTLLRG